MHLPVGDLGRYGEVVEEVERVLEGGPPLGLAVPALGHQAVHGVRTEDTGRLRHPVAPLDVLNHLPVVHTCARRRRRSGGDDAANRRRASIRERSVRALNFNVQGSRESNL